MDRPFPFPFAQRSESARPAAMQACCPAARPEPASARCLHRKARGAPGCGAQRPGGRVRAETAQAAALRKTSSRNSPGRGAIRRAPRRAPGRGGRRRAQRRGTPTTWRRSRRRSYPNLRMHAVASTLRPRRRHPALFGCRPPSKHSRLEKTTPSRRATHVKPRPWLNAATPPTPTASTREAQHKQSTSFRLRHVNLVNTIVRRAT